MAHSVEVRCPFLDHRIVELASHLPGGLKINHGINKYVHKLAVRNLLPSDLLERPKEGFVQPNYSWMRTCLRTWVWDTLSPSRLQRHQFFRPEYVNGLLHRHYNCDADLSAQLWNLLCFQLWWENCSEGSQV
jgi:asparagine synthase (glutamine-hydrolysing)